MDEQSLKQRKISLATSEHSSTIVELIKDCIQQTPLVGKTEWETIVAAITLDVQSTMLRDVVDYIDRIKKGALLEQK
jgi:hypothetical protein